jgi:drug/metabolite transporter (DMT)-like permease
VYARALERISWPLLVTVLFWGYNFVSIKLLYRQMTPGSLLLVRHLGMHLFLIAVCLAWGHSIWVHPEDRKRAFTAGALATGTYMVLFLEGMQRVTPTEGAIVLATVPILTYLLAVAFRVDRWQPGALGGIAIAYVGVAMVILGTGMTAAGTWLGRSLVFLAALNWAGAALVARPVLNQNPPITLLTTGMFGALPIVAAYGWADTLRLNWAAFTPTTWANLAQVTICSGGIAFICFYAGLHAIGPAKATTYQYFVPILAAGFAWGIYGQPLQWIQWLGIAVVLLGVAAAAHARNQASTISSRNV